MAGVNWDLPFGYIGNWFPIMGSFRRARSQQLAQLRLQLADAGRLLDEIEKRSLHKRESTASKLVAIDQLSNLTAENTETRFAACVAFGLAKIRQE